MTTLFTTTLETALTGTNGFSSVGASAPTLDTASTIKGAQCARWNAATSGVGTLQPAADQSTVYFSFYIKINAHVAAPRFVRAVDNAGVTSINLVINNTGTPSVKLRNGSTTIGTSATQLAAGTIYRIGIKIVKNSGVGVADGIAELYIATGDTAFGAAQVSNNTQIIDNQIDKIEVGPTNGVAIDCWMDDLIWSDSAMPAASSGGAFPAGPSGLTATVASATSVNLLWIDNATNETAYTVERATNPAGPWTILSSTLPANTTTYTATGLTTSTTYYFRVKATNASGSSAYSATASATPVSVGAWNWTEFSWPYRERYQPITLAATGGIGYVAITSDDPTNPAATYTYYSGPLVSETLTAVANESAARAAAVALPNSGRWILPSVLEARAVRLWHRHTVAYTVREFYPYRVVEADQVTAQFIRGMYISGHQLVVDNLAALSANLGTVTAGTFRTAESGARTVMTSDVYGGLVTYDTDDNFDTTNGSGTYQVWISTLDGKLYAGGGALIIDSTGLRLQANVGGAVAALKWYDSDTLISQIFASIDISGTTTFSINGGTVNIAQFQETSIGARFVNLNGTVDITGALNVRANSGNNSVTTRPNHLVLFGSTNPNLKTEIGIDTALKILVIGMVEEGTAYRDIVLANNGGNVGIGATIAPTEKLAVVGNINISGVYKNAGVQVLGTRKTGWAAPTGTATRSAFATSTVTLSQLAERVKALIDDMTSHGAIGA